MAQPRLYSTTYKTILKDGTVIMRERTLSYVPKTNRPIITDDMRATVIKLNDLMVPKTKIAVQVGISVKRVNTILRRNLIASDKKQ